MKLHKLSALITIACAASALSAQQPDLVNAKVETRSAAAGLEPAFRALVQASSGAAWIAYGVPIVPGNRSMCCNDSFGGSDLRDCGPCHLEGLRSNPVTSNNMPQRVELEAPRSLWVFFRVDGRSVKKLRTFTQNCQIDAGGLPVYWLSDARPPESVALLSTFVSGAGENDEENDEHLSNGALGAIALTNDPSADQAMDRFVASNQPESMRGHAAFWLGEARGRHGLEVLRRMVHDDPSEKVREKAVFGLNVSKEPDAVQALIDAAHEGSPRVRGQALFWMAQKASKKLAQTIAESAETDPDTEVKQRAVFALSQLPPDEGVPLLIHVAQTNRNMEVRRKAIFWLGQSRDPRALNYIGELLTR